MQSSFTRTLLRWAQHRRSPLRRAAIGGTAWTVQRVTGNGMTGPRTPQAAGEATGYVFQAARAVAAGTAAGTLAADRDWTMVYLAGTSLRVGDVLQSVEDAALRFTVQRIEQLAGVTVATLEQVR